MHDNLIEAFYKLLPKRTLSSKQILCSYFFGWRLHKNHRIILLPV